MTTKYSAGPFPIAAPSQVFAGLRGAKQASSLLERDGGDYIAEYSQRVTPSDVGAIFGPAWVDGYSKFDTVSYAIYRFDLTARTGKLTINTQWTQGLAEKKLLWLGASNWVRDRWDWSSGAPDGVVDTGVEGMALYKHPDSGEMYVAVVLLGQGAALLRKVWLTCSKRGDWWMEGRNSTHHSCSPFTGPDSPALKWQASTCENFYYSALVYDADGVLYQAIGGPMMKAQMCAINPDGTQQWVKELSTSREPLSNAAVADDGTVYVA